MIKKIRESLMLKWMVFSILLTTLPLAIAGFNIIQVYQKDLKGSVIESEKEHANRVVDRTRGFFEKVSSNLLLAGEMHLKNITPKQLRRYLEKFLDQNDYFVGLTFLNQKGRETLKVSKYKVFSPSDLKDQSKSEMFEVVSKGQIFYKYLLSDEKKFPEVTVAVPVGNYPDNLVGVLSAEVHLRYLWNLIPQIQMRERCSVYLVGKGGFLIAHPDASHILLGPFVDRAIAGEEGSLEYEDLRGGKYLVVYKPIKELGWGVIVQVPVEEAYAPLRQVANTALKWILIALSIAIIFSLFLTRKLTYPIKQLSHQMGKVSQGNLDVQIAPTTKDELGFLTESFNQMIQDLKQSHEALKEAEEKYRRIFEDSKDMVYITSVKGKVIDVNQAGVDLFGYESKEEMMQVYVRDTFFNPEDRKRFRNEIRKEWFVKDFEVKLKRKDGTPIDVLITANARRDDSGNITSYEGIIKDIADRKRMEDELVQGTRELESLNEMGALINQSLVDLDTLFPIALEKAVSLTGYDEGAIYLANDEEQILELKYHINHPAALAEKGRVLKYGEGVSGRAVELKQPVIFSMTDYPCSRLAPFLKEHGIQTLLGFPLLAKGKVVGTITLLSHSPRELTQKEVNLLESIGNQIGMAIGNAKLFSDVAKAKSEWETTFDAVTDLITIRDKDYRIIRANKAAIKRFGIDPKEMVGRKCYELLHHKELPCEGCYVTEALKTKKPASGERESLYLKGIFQYYTFPIYDEVGEVIMVVDIAREITEERKQRIEKEVVNNINKILASSPDVRKLMKAVHSELKRVLDSERMAITLFEKESEGFQYFVLEKDYEAKELLEGIIYSIKGTPFEKTIETGLPVIVPDTLESDSWLNQRLNNEGIRSFLIIPLEYKGKMIGTINFGSKKTNYFSEDHVRFLQHVAAGLAISIENSLLLDGIKQSEEKYRTVVESALDGVLVVGEDYRFKYVNERLAEILGFTREELIGMDFRNYLDKGSKELVADQYARRQRGEEVPSRYEFNILRKDGEIRNVEISSSLVKDSRGNVNTIAFIKDITEKRKMEEQLLQNEKLRALGEMASGVAHDFNNALAAILGNTQLLLYTAKDEELKESLKIIEKVTQDSAKTVKRLQDFTRRRVHQELYKLDVNSIIKDAIEITKPKWKDEAQGRGVDIEMVLNLEEIPSVSGNASELREVITNLIFNAIEAMPEGGRIEIRTFQRREKAYIQISDTGIGMAEEVRKKVFEPFFTTKPFSNTGLGLSMSYGVIKRFGGEIEVESKVGHGTTFTIILPPGIEGKEESIIPSLIRKGVMARILVIDDEESVRSVLSKILSQINHRVTVAENGEEGIRLFREKDFDMVLTDLGMPGMSGWEVCRAIKKMSPNTPVGMITGWGVEMDQAKMEENGIDFVIPKPFQFDQILKVVDETITSKGKPLMT